MDTLACSAIHFPIIWACSGLTPVRGAHGAQTENGCGIASADVVLENRTFGTVIPHRFYRVI